MGKDSKRQKLLSAISLQGYQSEFSIPFVVLSDLSRIFLPKSGEQSVCQAAALG
jgi:hypothetical protein